MKVSSQCCRDIWPWKLGGVRHMLLPLAWQGLALHAVNRVCNEEPA